MSLKDQPVPRILVAPLDWGLGHATRCIPVVRQLLAAGATVILAGEGPTEKLLRAEFPQLSFLPLQGYRVRYAQRALSLQILLQLPRLLGIVKKERSWLDLQIKKHKLDAVISDNRYGLYSNKVPCIFITHQLQVRTGFNWCDTILRSIHYRFIQRFSSCWIPDAEGTENLAGKLSHPSELPSIPCFYTGPLSRFSGASNEDGEHLLLLLSGPEPQRTKLEHLICAQLPHISEKMVLVRGLPEGGPPLQLPASITVFTHLPARELGDKVRRARLVIARSGYSTVMDLAALGKKSILVPTPGQTEQEYLAGRLQSCGFALAKKQEQLVLTEALKEADSFAYHPFPLLSHDGLAMAIDQLFQKLNYRPANPTS